MQELATPRSLLHGLHGPPCRILTPLRRSAVSVQTLTYFWLESERPLLKAAFRPAGGRWIHSFGGLPGSNLDVLRCFCDVVELGLRGRFVDILTTYYSNHLPLKPLI